VLKTEETNLKVKGKSGAYIVICDNCGDYEHPVNSKKDAANIAKFNGYKNIDGNTLCKECQINTSKGELNDPQPQTLNSKR
jgi:hypothetical protein